MCNFTLFLKKKKKTLSSWFNLAHFLSNPADILHSSSWSLWDSVLCTSFDLWRPESFCSGYEISLVESWPGADGGINSKKERSAPELSYFPADSCRHDLRGSSVLPTGPWISPHSLSPMEPGVGSNFQPSDTGSYFLRS